MIPRLRKFAPSTCIYPLPPVLLEAGGGFFYLYRSASSILASMLYCSGVIFPSAIS